MGISYHSITTPLYPVITLLSSPPRVPLSTLSLFLACVARVYVPLISPISRITLGSQRRRRRHAKHDKYRDETPITRTPTADTETVTMSSRAEGRGQNDGGGGRGGGGLSERMEVV